MLLHKKIDLMFFEGMAQQRWVWKGFTLLIYISNNKEFFHFLVVEASLT
jgi:hypothetical protein